MRLTKVFRQKTSDLSDTFTGQKPFLSPTNSIKSTEGISAEGITQLLTLFFL